MRYIISVLIVCCFLSCSKEDAGSNAAVLVKAGSHDDLLSNTIVTIKSDTLPGTSKIVRQSPCGADDAAYFKSLPPGWYHVAALGYSKSQKRHLKGDTLFQVFYRAGQNYYEINLFMK